MCQDNGSQVPPSILLRIRLPDDAAADDVIAATALADAGVVVVVAADVVAADRDAVAGAHDADVAALPLSVAHTRCTYARVHTRALLY